MNPFETTMEAEERRRREEKSIYRVIYRVICDRTHSSKDGSDLVIKGTHGTLMGWSDDAPQTNHVVVKWDHHMYCDSFDEDRGATGVGLMTDIDPSHITHIGKDE